MRRILLLALLLAASGANAEQSGSWSIERSQSNIDDSEVIQATNVDPSADSGSNRPAVLIVGCEEGLSSFGAITQGFWGIGPKGSTRHVIYRLGKAKAVDDEWLAVNANGILYPSRSAAGQIKFLRSLPSTGTFVLRVTTSIGSVVESVFTLDGIDGVRSALAKACHWPAE